MKEKFILYKNKANAKRGLTCCPQDSYKQLAGHGVKFTDIAGHWTNTSGR